jgi:hypothetical protein
MIGESDGGLNVAVNPRDPLGVSPVRPGQFGLRGRTIPCEPGQCKRAWRMNGLLHSASGAEARLIAGDSASEVDADLIDGDSASEVDADLIDGVQRPKWRLSRGLFTPRPPRLRTWV